MVYCIGSEADGTDAAGSDGGIRKQPCERQTNSTGDPEARRVAGREKSRQVEMTLERH